MDPRKKEDEYSEHVRRILGSIETKGRASTCPGAVRHLSNTGRSSSARAIPGRPPTPTTDPRSADNFSRNDQRTESRGSASASSGRGCSARVGSGSRWPATVGGEPGAESNGRHRSRSPRPVERLDRTVDTPGSTGASKTLHDTRHNGRSAVTIAPAHGAFSTACTSRPRTTTSKEHSGSEDVDVSPRAAKKVLPHFLAIGKPGSQALVPKEGAEIVQRQALARFGEKKLAHAVLDENMDADMRRRQMLKWKEYEHREEDERKRLRQYLQGVKIQAEMQRTQKEKKRSGEFHADNPDPNRAYPCRIEYNAAKEAEWRRAWCRDLEAQVKLKQRLGRQAKDDELTSDRLRARQLAAAIKADRHREDQVQEQDRARIYRAWESQAASSVHLDAAKRTQTVFLDKIVR